MDKNNYIILTIFAVACIPYCVVINGPFLLDDPEAILKNWDVLGLTKYSQLWFDDFWGGPLTAANSHKSYRPIVVSIFRLIYFLCETWTAPYHVINILVHGVVSWLFYLVCQNIVFYPSHSHACLVAGLLFALHPVHTEVVCGIVGLSELLSALCFLTAILVYFDDNKISNENNLKKDEQEKKVQEERNTKETTNDRDASIRKRNVHIQETISQGNSDIISNDDPGSIKADKKDDYKSPSMYHLLYVVILTTIGMLCKETCITILPVILVLHIMQKLKNCSKIDLFTIIDHDIIIRCVILTSWGFVLMLFRFWIMGWKAPEFVPADNPAAFAEHALTRFLTYCYLAWYNFYLLLCPTNLSYDYATGAIPLVASVFEARSVTTLLFFVLFGGFAVLCSYFYLLKRGLWPEICLKGYFLIILTFLPASNLLFRVGFVVAERVLYLPSAGFIIILTIAWTEVKMLYPASKRFLNLLLATLLCFYLYHTVTRSLVWTDEFTFYEEGKNRFPESSKMRHNYAVRLSQRKMLAEAEAEYVKALELTPDYFISLVNLASIYYYRNKSREAEELCKRAINVFPHNPSCYFHLIKNYELERRRLEAYSLLKKASTLVKGDFSKLLFYAREYAKMDTSPTKDSQRLYFAFLKRLCLQESHLAIFVCLKEYNIDLQLYIQALQQKGNDEAKMAAYLLIGKLNEKDENTSKKLIEILKQSYSLEEAHARLLNIKYN